MNLFKNKYRVVRDEYAGYEAQIRLWWFPLLWFQISDVESGFNWGCNTRATIATSKVLIEEHKKFSYPREIRRAILGDVVYSE